MHAHQGHGHHHAEPPPAGASTRAFAIATLLNLAYTVLEAGYGLATNSLALLSDALHNFGDVLGLALAWAAAVVARWPPTERHTYGWRRATHLSPLANATLLVGLSGALAWEALRRLGAPPAVPGATVIVVAAVGIAVNLAGAWLMRSRGNDGHDLNRRGAFLHLVADAAISLATVVAGAGILWLGWAWLDPAIALLVGVVVAIGAIGLLRDSFNATMDAVPPGIDQRAVSAFLLAQPGVRALHHLHIWSLGGDRVALTAHLVVPDRESRDGFIAATAAALEAGFGINHATLQVETGTGCGEGMHGVARDTGCEPGGASAATAVGHPHGHAPDQAHDDPDGHPHGEPVTPGAGTGQVPAHAALPSGAGRL